MHNLRWHLATLVLYSFGAWLMLDHGASLTATVLGNGRDPSLIMWFLAWWPWSLTHHVFSLHTQLVWQPVGLNLAWTTCVPLLALLGLPATLLGGPILAFNILTLLAPTTGAFAAYLLCLELFEHPTAALAGGWLFGFSAFESAQSFDHLNLDFTMLLPLILMVVLRRVRGKSGRIATILWLAALLAGEFYTSDEMLATAAFLGAVAWALAYDMLAEMRRPLRRLATDLMLTAPLALLFISPVLWAMLTGGFDVAHPAKWPRLFSIDLLNFFLPTLATSFGGSGAFGIAQNFPGGLDEQDGYIGPVVIFILLFALGTLWRHRALRFTYVMLGVILIATLGPELRIDGAHTGIPLPWIVLLHLPLLNAALPARCMVYATLLIAILLAAWLAEHPTRLRLWAALFACASWMPVIHPVTPSPFLAFFRPGEVQATLGPNPRLLILPFGIAGPSSYWQAENQFGFSQVGGYLGYPPISMQHYPAAMELFSSTFLGHFTAQFVDFCHATGAQFIVATPQTAPGEWSALRALDWKAQKIDDVTVFTVPAT